MKSSHVLCTPSAWDVSKVLRAWPHFGEGLCGIDGGDFRDFRLSEVTEGYRVVVVQGDV